MTTSGIYDLWYNLLRCIVVLYEHFTAVSNKRNQEELWVTTLCINTTFSWLQFAYAVLQASGCALQGLLLSHVVDHYLDFYLDENLRDE